MKPIRTEADNETALARIYELMQLDLSVEPDKRDELELLSILVENYEREAYPVPPPHPIEAIKFRMEQMGLPISEFEKIVGKRNSPQAILDGKRKLSVKLIRTLHQKLKIPAEVLIMEY